MTGITKSIISILRNDSTLRTLLGASSANAAPIYAEYALENITGPTICVAMVLGESHHTGYSDGTMSISVYVPGSAATPVSTVESIVSRIEALLNMKGSQLNDSYTTAVYRLRRTGYDSDFDEQSQAVVGTVDYEFYTSM